MLSFRAKRSGVEKSLGWPGVGASLVGALPAHLAPWERSNALARRVRVALTSAPFANAPCPRTLFP